MESSWSLLGLLLLVLQASLLHSLVPRPPPRSSLLNVKNRKAVTSAAAGLVDEWEQCTAPVWPTMTFAELMSSPRNRIVLKVMGERCTYAAFARCKNRSLTNISDDRWHWQTPWRS